MNSQVREVNVKEVGILLRISTQAPSSPVEAPIRTMFLVQGMGIMDKFLDPIPRSTVNTRLLSSPPRLAPCRWQRPQLPRHTMDIRVQHPPPPTTTTTPPPQPRQSQPRRILSPQIHRFQVKRGKSTTQA